MLYQQKRRFIVIIIIHDMNINLVLSNTFYKIMPFLSRLMNKLPNIDTDVPSNLSIRGEFAYLAPGAPKGTDFNNEATVYVDDFEGNQGAIELLSPQAWFLSSRPRTVNGSAYDALSNDPGIQNGYDRAWLNWYTIDPIFYSAQRPGEINDDDVSNLYTRRVFIDEVFDIDIVQGQSTVINTLDLAYYPEERGPYNFDPTATNGITDPTQSWAGITRAITSTDFEQANVEFIDFWVQDPFLDNTTNPGGTLFFNLGNISEDVLKDGKKQYENGLPENGDVSILNPTEFGGVVPQNQSLVYAFSTTGQDRANQDVGYDGYDDAEEAAEFGTNFGPDPSNDNYLYFLNTDGNIFERYKFYNCTKMNTPDTFTETNRSNKAQLHVEHINRDNTIYSLHRYFESEIDITPTRLADPNNTLINDIRTRTVTLPNGD